MIAPAIPEDEGARLSALRDLRILDTPAEDRFDLLTRLASRVFKVPIALVSLVDENRQWFKSCVGLDVPETSREVSFCGHAILQDGVFVIEDALLDDRFRDNPLVVGSPGIRFYAGRPLRVEGRKIGTLCLIDTEPRKRSDLDLSVLDDLARLTERELCALSQSQVDELTGVANRRGFIRLATQGISMSRRKKANSALVYFDLNGFKLINDTFGHKEGDRALKDFARIVYSSVREGDILGRLGGDEFILWINEASGALIEGLLRRITENVEAHNARSGAGYGLSFSHGAEIIAFDDPSAFSDLVEQVDRKMYDKKRQKPASPGPHGPRA
ncbi:MAG: sensor domain-containing diguanylate cyclase [Spirochaetes bacterium]|nr:sensor domain-containing diguanylate cyclase [Spirochaetota bacterium]MBU1080411.1 sensor domain-containing diguanylate cyclase [Spirochaetota bacterium]